jgi:hypothetical protein
MHQSKASPQQVLGLDQTNNNRLQMRHQMGALPVFRSQGTINQTAWEVCKAWGKTITKWLRTSAILTTLTTCQECNL